MSLHFELLDSFPVLKTERLILRKVLLTDAKDIFEYASNPIVSKYLVWQTHKNIEDTKEFICQVIQGYISREPANWGIEFIEENRLIGIISFLNWDQNHFKAEVGFVLSDKYWRKGIISEALNKVLYFGFTRMFLNRIEARTMVNNIASQKLLEKIGMKFEGVLYEQMYIKDNFENIKLYSILKKDFLR